MRDHRPPTLRTRTAGAARVAAILSVFLVLSALRAAAVSVSPLAVYIDDRSRTGTLTLYNPGSRPEEIRVEFGFGYPTSDDEGNVTVNVTEAAPAGEPSALPWLQAFPQRLVLEPGQRQVVRIIARPPSGLPQGEYWARALVRARGGQAPIEQRTGDVSVSIEVETVVVVAVNYRNGAVSTGLRVDAASAEAVGDTVAATVDLTREGNAAFLGRLRVELLDAAGRVVAEREEVLAVYRSIRRRVLVAVPEGAVPVTARLTMDTRRSDLPPGGPLPVEPVVLDIPLR
jgi:hypothetical protein